jgi:hypothetical protein
LLESQLPERNVPGSHVYGRRTERK